MYSKNTKIRIRNLFGTALLGVGTMMAVSSMASAAPRGDLRDERKDVKEARKEVKQERKDLRKADSKSERREAREDLREAKQDLRRERHDLKDGRRGNHRDYKSGYNRPSYNRPGYKGPGAAYRPGYNGGFVLPNYSNRPNYNYPNYNYPNYNNRPAYNNGDWYNGRPGYNNGSRNNSYQTYTGTVTDIDDNGNIDIRVGGSILNVYDADLPRGLDEGDIVRVYGVRTGDKSIHNANVVIVNNR